VANTDGTLRLNLITEDATTGRTHVFPFMMRGHEAGWKIVIEGEVPANFGDLARWGS